MDRPTRVIALLAALSFVGTAQDRLYFQDGDERTFEVRPPVTEITSITWYVNSDRVLDWSTAADLEIYPRFKNRTSLDTKNGRLVIKHMTKGDAGEFSVHVNDKVRSGKYDMRWIVRVGKPEVVIDTTCSPDSEQCTATCDGGTAEAAPIEYEWKIGSAGWMGGTKDLNITKVDHGGAEFIACRMKNPVSEISQSEQVKNPLFKGPLPTGAIVGIGVVAGVATLTLTLAFCCFSKKKKKFCFHNKSHSDTIVSSNPGHEGERLKDAGEL